MESLRSSAASPSCRVVSTSAAHLFGLIKNSPGSWIQVAIWVNCGNLSYFTHRKLAILPNDSPSESASSLVSCRSN